MWFANCVLFFLCCMSLLCFLLLTFWHVVVHRRVLSIYVEMSLTGNMVDGSTSMVTDAIVYSRLIGGSIRARQTAFEKVAVEVFGRGQG